MTLRQYAGAIRKRAWLLVLVPALGVASAVAISLVLPPVYESEASVLVRPAQPISSLDQSNSAITADQVSRTNAQLMTQRLLLEKVVSDLRLNITPDQLQRSVKVTPEANTTVLKVTVQNGDRTLARDIANKLVDDFIAETKQIQQSQVDQYTARIEAQLEQLRNQIQTEQARIDQLQGQLNQKHALKPEEQSELTSLQQQITAERSQYFEIVRSESDIEVNVARATDGVIVVSPAVKPATPASPKLWLNAPLACLGGLALAVGLILLLDHLDQSITNDEQLIERTGLLPLAQIPFSSAGKRAKEGLAVLTKDPADTEPYKTLRTNILFSTVDRQPKTITISSALPAEGKSWTAANLAIALAAAGHRTVLIDCDFRRPAQHRLFGRVRNVGLTDLILGVVTEPEVIVAAEEVPNLWVITSGPTPPNPSELLGSGRMKELLKQITDQFTHVVIDTPPVNVVADGLVVASYTDVTLLVVEHGRTRYPAVRNAREALERVGGRVLGGVLNKVKSREDRYRYYGHSANGSAPPNTKVRSTHQRVAALELSQEPPNLIL